MRVDVMKKIRSLLLGLLSLSMLVSCSGAANEGTTSSSSNNKTNNEQNNEDNNPYVVDDQLMYRILSSWDPKVNINYNEDLNPVFDEMDEIAEEDQDKLSSTMFDVPRGSQLHLQLKDDVSLVGGTAAFTYQMIAANHVGYISVKDVENKPVNLALSFNAYQVSIEFNNAFEYGGVYIVKLEEKANLRFAGKDPSIQQLTIEIEDEPSEQGKTYDNFKIKDDIPVLDLQYVSDEQVYDNGELSFVYSSTLPTFAPNDIFLVKSDPDDSEMNMLDFYGVFKEKEQVDGSKWKVTYIEPKGEDIYDELRLKNVKPVDLSGIEVLMTKKSIQSQFRYSNTSRGLINFFAKYAETLDSKRLGSLIDHIAIDIDFKYVDDTLTFTFAISLKKIKLTDNLYLSFQYVYQQVTKYTVDFDISLKTKWYIPVGINYKVKCIEDMTESHSFYVVVDYTSEEQEKTEEEIEEDLVSQISDAKDDKDNFFKRIKDSDDAQKEVEGNQTKFPLFEIPIPIGEGLIFEIRLEFIIDITIEAMFVVKKQVKSNRVLFNFSNEEGGGQDEHQSITGSSIWDIYLMGMAQVKFSLRFAVALYFEGTYKYLHFEGYAELWLKIGVQGTIMASFDTGTDASVFSGNLAIDFYVQMGLDVGYDIVLAIFDFSGSANIFKTYIFRLCLTNTLEHYSDNTVTEINLNKTQASIDDYDILCFRIWDGVNMIMDNKRYKADDEQPIIESWIGDLGVKLFEFTPEDSSLMTISDDGLISIPDETPADFVTHFTIHVHKAASLVSDREITVNFSAPDAHHIYLDDEDMGRYRPGVTFTLPEPPKRDGYRFLDYKIGDEIVDPGYVITMADQDVYVTSEWHKIMYYAVYFYDGKNNLIFVNRRVEEFTSATPPEPEIRDQYMEGYQFIGWDKKLDNVQSDLLVHGIYVKVGD